MKLNTEINKIESIIEKIKEKNLALELKIEEREDVFNNENEIETIESALEELKNLSE